MWKRCSMHRKFISNSIRFTSIALVLTLLLSACGKTATLPQPTGGKVGGTDAPISGGSINIVMPANPSTLNPMEVNSREMVDLYGLIYDSLVRFDEQMRPIPGLAERWEASTDGKTWTFHLQKNAAFHDGKLLESSDVLYSLNLLKSIYSDSSKTSLYSGVFSLIANFSAPDANTVVITTKESSACILAWLNFPVLKKDSLQSGSIAPGTGAYKVESYEAGKQLVLKANANWWRRAPYITTIVAKAMPDPDTALTSMDVKLVDVVHSVSLTAHSYKRQSVTNVYELMTQEYECIIPNMTKSSLQDIRMRKAIIAALDRKTIITEKYLNHAVSIDVPITPDSYLYETTHAQHTYNPSAAKELLFAMGYSDSNKDGILEKDGVPLHLDIIVNENTLNSARVDAAKMAQDQLKLIGIDSTLKRYSFSDFRSKLASGAFDLAFAAFSIPADGDLRFLLKSDSSKNYGKYQDSDLDSLLATYAGALDESGQKNASAAVQKYITEKLPVISLYFRTNALVSSAAVLGITGGRDMNVYKTVEQWYMFKEGDEDKLTTKAPQ